MAEPIQPSEAGTGLEQVDVVEIRMDERYMIVFSSPCH